MQIRLNTIIFALFAALTSSTPAAWANGSTTTSLNTWVSKVAGPELAQTLSRHPKFKGRPLHIGGFSGEQTSPLANQLQLAIRQQLTDYVLSVRDIKMLPAQDTQCYLRRPQSQTTLRSGNELYIGIAVAQATLGQSNNRYLVRIRAFDPSDGHWVGGISLRWQGRLTSTQQKAYRQSITNIEPGSIQAPFRSLSDRGVIATLQQQLDCATLEKLPGTFAIQQNSEHGDLLNYVKSRVEGADDDQTADWFIEAHSTQTQGLSLVQVNLRPNDNGTVRTIAEFYVADTAGKRVGGPVDRGITGTPAEVYADVSETKPVQPGSLLAHLRPTRASRCKDCVEFKLKTDAYVLVFSTIGSKVIVPSCTESVKWRQRDAYAFRIKDRFQPQYAHRPQYGVYVIASKDPAPLKQISNQLNALSSTCGEVSSPGQQRDMSGLLHTVNHMSAAIDWLAYHDIET